MVHAFIVGSAYRCRGSVCRRHTCSQPRTCSSLFQSDKASYRPIAEQPCNRQTCSEWPLSAFKRAQSTTSHRRGSCPTHQVPARPVRRCQRHGGLRRTFHSLPMGRGISESLWSEAKPPPNCPIACWNPFHSAKSGNQFPHLRKRVQCWRLAPLCPVMRLEQQRGFFRPKGRHHSPTFAVTTGADANLQLRPRSSRRRRCPPCERGLGYDSPPVTVTFTALMTFSPTPSLSLMRCQSPCV